jgi:hypothetical protein
MSGYTLTPDQDDVFKVLQPWLATVTGLPPDYVIQGLGNRVSMPPARPGFIAMTALFQSPLEWPSESFDATQDPPVEMSVTQPDRVTIQLDFYGSRSQSWSALVKALWHTPYAVTALAPTCAPLGMPDVRLMPLDSSEQQYEHRWTGSFDVQVNQTTSAPQTFANDLDASLADVSVAFPPN